MHLFFVVFFFFFQAEDGIRDSSVTGVQTCALPISVREGKAYAVLHTSSLSSLKALFTSSTEASSSSVLRSPILVPLATALRTRLMILPLRVFGSLATK